MAQIAADDQWLVEKHIFGLFWRDLVAVPVLLSVLVIPIETGAVIERVSVVRHSYKYTMNIYTLVRWNPGLAGLFAALNYL